MPTAYATHSRFLEHADPYGRHPERPERLEAVWRTLDEAGLTERLRPVTPQPAGRDLLARVHSNAHLNTLKWIAAQKQATLIDRDTYALPQSFDIADLAAGSVVQVVEAVLNGSARNGLAAVRPPGHHATPEHPMGFCLINNVAVAARYVQQAHAIKRVLIVDYDVHHGNGTQDIFYQDKSVLFISVHQHGFFYPGTGALHEIGQGEGRGYTINVPLPGQHGDKSYALIFEQVIWAAARRFQPQFILVSAGFDAHPSDHLSSMQLSLTGYDHIARELIRMADELCGGKIVFVLEGGYDLRAVGHGVRNLAHALLGDPTVSDPYGLATRSEPDARYLVEQVKQLHGL